MKRSPRKGYVVLFVMGLLTLTAACSSDEAGIGGETTERTIDNSEAVEAALAQRISDYLDVLTIDRDADAAREFYTEDARLVGPGMDMDRMSLVENMRATFESGVQVQVNRRTLEVFVHSDAAYEMAQTEDVFLGPDGVSADTVQNHMFIRWERGDDGEWRFDRVLLSPMTPSSGG